ncbi:helix-turn-helix domain-containing protein [Puteibacter caeruleilacunae]|nr:helix-turn-helix domain-containing protein [Puteibacter caeruleilacunae]
MSRLLHDKKIRTYTFNKEKDKFNAHVFRIEEKDAFIKINNTPFIVDFYEVFFITNGEGYIYVDAEKIDVKEGMVICIPPQKVREWDLKSTLKGYALIFEDEFFRGFFNDELFTYRFNIFNNTTTPSGVWFNKEAFESILHHLDELLEEGSSVGPESQHLFRATYYLLLVKINRHYAKEYNIETELLTNSFLVKFRKLLSDNICDKHTVADYATILDISRITLNQLCKKYFGKTATMVIREQLTARAKTELLYSNKSITEIAYDLNFSDKSNFFRFFKKMTGMKPTDFKSLLSN